MAKRTRIVEVEEPDQLAGFAHPRNTTTLIGQDATLERAARQIRGGKPPSGWLISGPPGIGKATFAYRIARYLLAHGAHDTGAVDLSVPPNDPAAMQMSAGAHPGLMLLRRRTNDKTGKLGNDLSVNEVRRLNGFFGMTSGAGGWRVAIVDTADDMNDNAANALLKLLEEPPPRAMLLLLANQPGRLLPTIRSRCQRLDLKLLDEKTLAAALTDMLPDTDAAERAALARLAGGSIGAALALAGEEGALLAAEADQLVDQAGAPDMLALLALSEKLWRMKDGAPRLGAFLVETLSARIRARARTGGAGLDRWTAALGRMDERFQRSTGLNLDPRQTLLSTARDLAQTAARAGQI